MKKNIKTNYILSELIDCIKSYFKIFPCILCGIIHPVCFHDYPIRKIRINDENHGYINIVIRIVVIFCMINKKKGKQHYKRLLPFFRYS